VVVRGTDVRRALALVVHHRMEQAQDLVDAARLHEGARVFQAAEQFAQRAQVEVERLDRLEAEGRDLLQEVVEALRGRVLRQLALRRVDAPVVHVGPAKFIGRHF
jgi:hypothetical protein